MKFKLIPFIVLIIFSTLKGISQNQENKIPIIIDADTANEIDDLFALVRAIGEPKFDLRGITASQFHTSPYASKNTALESHLMNQKLLNLLPKYNIPLFLGNSKPITEIANPNLSDASKFIIEQALSIPKEKKLHVVILGSCTNVATALKYNPEIASKLIVYYIGFWHDPYLNIYDKNEFNTRNDQLATNFLLNSKNLNFNVMTATTCQNLQFDKANTFRNFKKDSLGYFLANRWENYKRWWTSIDPDQKKWIMWDLSIIEAIIHPEWATKKVFKTPKDNLQRDIQVYTSIDSSMMKKDFWEHYNKLN